MRFKKKEFMRSSEKKKMRFDAYVKVNGSTCEHKYVCVCVCVCVFRETLSGGNGLVHLYCKKYYQLSDPNSESGN